MSTRQMDLLLLSFILAGLAVFAGLVYMGKVSLWAMALFSILAILLIIFLVAKLQGISFKACFKIFAILVCAPVAVITTFFFLLHKAFGGEFFSHTSILLRKKPTRKCPKCGAQNLLSRRYCLKCGEDIFK